MFITLDGSTILADTNILCRSAGLKPINSCPKCGRITSLETLNDWGHCESCENNNLIETEYAERTDDIE